MTGRQLKIIGQALWERSHLEIGISGLVRLVTGERAERRPLETASAVALARSYLDVKDPRKRAARLCALGFDEYGEKIEP